MRKQLIRNSVALLTLLVATLTVQAQGKEIVFTPQWHASAQFAGYIAANAKGFYEQEGVRVAIKYPAESKSSVDLLREGKAHLVTTMLTDAVMLKANGVMDLVNVLQTSQHAALCLALKKPMDQVEIDRLQNFRVGLWPNRMALSAEAMNNQHRLNWTIILFSRGFKLMTYDVVDAISVMEYNELLQLKYNGKDVSKHSVLRMCENGYDIPEDGVYCTRDYYQQHTKEVKAFVRASKKGWEWCRQHPEEATELVAEEMRKTAIHFSKVIQRAGLKVILKKQELKPGEPSYTLQLDQFENAINVLKAAELIETFPDFKNFIAR